MANQPVFRADPNAVPKINGIPGMLDSVAKGYKLAQLPAQMKMETMLKQAQLKKSQADATNMDYQNQYYPQRAEQELAQGRASQANIEAQTGYTNKQASRYDDTVNSSLARDRALNANTAAQTSLYNTQAAGAQDDLNYQRALYAAIQRAQQAQAQQGDGAPQGQPSPNMQPPSYQPGQGGAPFAAPTQAGQQQGAPASQGGQPMQAPQQQPAPQNTAQPPASEKVIQQGNQQLSYLDSIAANPLYAGQLAKMKIPGVATDTKYDAKSGQMITTTQYPSGKVTASATPLIDPAQQAQTAQMEELNKKIADQSAIKFGDYTKDLNSAVKIQGDINSLAQSINVPAFDNAVGPVNDFFHRNLGLGDAETNELFGTINSVTGLIQGEMANSISGNAAKAKLYFAQMIKPSSKDTAPVFRGKMEAINTANNWSVDYNAYLAKAIRTGTPVDEAILAADKAVSWDKYRGQMDSFLKNGQLASKYQGQGLPISYQDSGQGDHHPYVDVKTPDGGTLSIPVEKYQSYLDKTKRSKNG